MYERDVLLIRKVRCKLGVFVLSQQYVLFYNLVLRKVAVKSSSHRVHIPTIPVHSCMNFDDIIKYNFWPTLYVIGSPRGHFQDNHTYLVFK